MKITVGKVTKGNQLKITQEHEWQHFISPFAFVLCCGKGSALIIIMPTLGFCF